ncbi:carboxymuconolactone decarboxylase family protein [Aliifodinibius sp. S!AR15-10]|uniref:carboxymuconolactone decarboxylase family protein n=1 Tax=Aliifodinibius sp. S!AR15-10 TaxID=2950437 RepID=UPI0028544818|nr:carboxymuconolactone decarboxylase family protein [Aliifodinibius sp. S!AR15-10]MDR8390713.1 carboxymuconolactone decarboxylase family protein [Aliifodinibius sp. S!AR15-10]
MKRKTAGSYSRPHKSRNTTTNFELDSTLMELVKLRISQINKCDGCVEKYRESARRIGEEKQRIHWLDAWTEAPLFTSREQAALAWTEVLSRISEQEIADDLYDIIKDFFSDEEIEQLTSAIENIKERKQRRKV